MSRSKGNNSNIKVFCRFRPFNVKELENKSEKIHRISNKSQLIVKDAVKNDETSFMFDHVFDSNSTQEEVYREVGLPVLENILDGFNGTIMAYGQTSSGKTHTMQGYETSDKDGKGIIPRIIENLFHSIEKSTDSLEFKLKVSIFQIYMEKARDLLDVTKVDLKIRQNKNGPYLQHLTEVYISDRVQFYKLIHLGQKNRITCVTNMNAHSSRSHMIFLLTLNQFNKETSQSKTSKLFLIDLAGSEKISKTGAQGKVLEQAKKINLSLTTLGKVIKSLSQQIQHIPYRQSKLTRIIKDSLGGNSKTTLIVTCSPHQIHLPETISTLRFGENAQKIKNKPKINRQLTVEELQKMIQKLEGQILVKDKWISILQNYIKTDLGSQLPQKLLMSSKIISTIDHQAQSELKETAQNEDKQQNVENYENKDQNWMEGVKNDKIQEEQNCYDENMACLEAQLQEYKKKMQLEVNKFYLLKDQYNTLNQNIKQLIEENIAYEDKLKENEEKMKQFQDIILSKYHTNCSYLIGEVLDKCADCTGPESCYGNIKAIVDEKGKGLCFKGEELRQIECWKQQKKKILELMEEKGENKLIMSQKEQRQQEQENLKIIELENKMDVLFQEYQEMVALQTNWKVECQLYERKLKFKEEKITELREMLEDISQQMELMNQDYQDTVTVRSKIVKPIKGGFLFK